MKKLLFYSTLLIIVFVVFMVFKSYSFKGIFLGNTVVMSSKIDNIFHEKCILKILTPEYKIFMDLIELNSDDWRVNFQSFAPDLSFVADDVYIDVTKNSIHIELKESIFWNSYLRNIDNKTLIEFGKLCD